MGKYDASIRIKTDIETDKAKINLKTLENQMEKLQRKTETLSKKKTSLESFTVKTEEYKKLEKQIAREEAELDKLNKLEDKWKEQGYHDKGTSWEELYSKRDAIGLKSDEIYEKMEALEKAGAAFTNRVDTDAYKKVCDDLANASNEAELLRDKLMLLNREIAQSSESKGSYKAISHVVYDLRTELAELEKNGFGFGDEIYDDIYFNLKNAEYAVKKYKKALESTTNENLDKEMDYFAEQDKKAAEKAAKLAEEVAEQKRLESIRVNAVVSNQKLLDLKKEQEAVTSRMADLKKAGVTEGYKEYDDLKKRLGQINTEASDLQKGYNTAAENGKKCMDALQRGTKKTNGLLTMMKSRLKGIALSLLVFNWISKGFNALVSSMQKGFENLAQYCKEYNEAMSDMKSESATLKNSLATAFSPIVTMAIPYITKLISWLNTAADSVAQFWAVLSGKSVYTRAKKQVVDYAKSLKDASGAAKGALASFDEINILNKDEGSAAGGEKTGADAFEEAEVDTAKFAWVDWLRENLDSILGYVGAIGAGLLAWQISSHFTDSLSKMLGIAVAVAGAFVLIKNAVDAWQNGIDWENLSGMLIGSTALVVGLGIAFGGVGAAVGALIAGFILLTVGFKDILENGVNLQNSLAVIAGVFLTVSAVAGTAIGAIAALTAGLVLAIIADWDNFKRNVVEPIWKWLSALLSNAGETAEGIKQFFSGIIEFFTGVFTGDWKKAWNGIKNIFSGAWKAMLGTVKLIVNTIIGIINTMINGLAGAINAVIRAINSINITLPDWVPVLGGKNFSPNIPNIPNPANIPYLATGGTVFQETYAKISEGNKKEVVLPLEQNTEWADLLAEKIGAGNGQRIAIRFEGSLAELGRVLKPVIDQENSRVGRSLAQS